MQNEDEVAFVEDDQVPATQLIHESLDVEPTTEDHAPALHSKHSEEPGNEYPKVQF